MKSILQNSRETCFLCGKHKNAEYYGLDEHHCYGGANRQISEKYGLKVYLCHDSCHLNGVHKNAEASRALKAVAQRKAMEHYGWSEEDFVNIIGKSYI